MIVFQNLTEFINKIICFFFGHDPYEYYWHNEYNYTLSHKGGKKRCHKTKTVKIKHIRIYCTRCGKILKKK